MSGKATAGQITYPARYITATESDPRTPFSVNFIACLFQQKVISVNFIACLFQSKVISESLWFLAFRPAVCVVDLSVPKCCLCSLSKAV